MRHVHIYCLGLSSGQYQKKYTIYNDNCGAYRLNLVETSMTKFWKDIIFKCISEPFFGKYRYIN